MRNRRTVLIALLALGLAGAIAATVALRSGLAADVAPGRVETAVARRLVWLSIPASARAMTNPRAANPDAWRTGADHFSEHCAVCHGTDGRASSEVAARMYPPVPSLAIDDIQRLSDGALFAIIQHGVRWTGMPAFGADHSAGELWDLVAFVRRVPTLTPEELHRPGDLVVNQHDGATDVAMDGTTFTPRELTVRVGSTVTWINTDPFPHNVTSAAAGIRSGDLGAGARWQFRPTTPGRIRYVCTLHPGMEGTLVIQP